MKTHILKPNDTLQRLAAYYYGNWTLWYLILEANPHLKKYSINEYPSGIKINLPDILVQELTHIVSKNDSYESISLKYFGTEIFSEKIKSFNNNIELSKNIGLEIYIPALEVKHV